MARTRSEFLWLTHIHEENSVAGGEPALQFNDLDPPRRIHASPSE
jgi:hypothetical protein